MIFFDLDGTLLDFKGAEFLGVQAFHQEHGSRLGLTAGLTEFYQEWCQIGKKHYTRFLQGKLTFRQQQMERIKELSEGLKEEAAAEYFQWYVRSFESHWKPFDDVIPCLEALKGNRLGIITNGDRTQQRQKLERMGIADYFEVVVASEEVGSSKPHPRIFERAAELAGLCLHELTYIGDDFATDIEPCEALSIRGIWLKREKKEEERSFPRTITTLHELKGHLKTSG
ncbi:HAD family hydrolase [Paenibacillus sp. CC-CFT747]|nr:HAD family hydrolase [Paenibacillus sp. CC-CFT747]